jgi:tetratricopeptide (TPR) repeat protein
MEQFNAINDLIVKFSSDPFNPVLSFRLAVEYERVGQTASAVSFYLRTAEYGYHTHGEHVYASLLKASQCFQNQTGRENTVRNLMEKAIAYSPKRPEAWFLLARYYEQNKKWQEAYTSAEVGIQNLPSIFSPLPVDVDYPGDFCLPFEKAVAAWWVGRPDESEKIFKTLLQQNLPDAYRNAIKANMDRLNMSYDVVAENNPFDKFLSEGFKAVPGWVVADLPEFLRLLKDVEWNKDGGVAELGVYMGRFFLLLRAMLDKAEPSYGIDIFEDQALNLDFSGTNKARQDIFQTYIDKYDAFGGEGVQIIKGDSTSSKTQAELAETIPEGSIRFFSIDGGHTKIHTLNDLKIAEKYVADAGVVILDDILHPHWLGVMDGLVQYLSDFPTLVPFAVGHNKMFLCKFSYHQKYLEIAQKSRSATKQIEFMGHKLWVVQWVNIG